LLSICPLFVYLFPYCLWEPKKKCNFAHIYM